MDDREIIELYWTRSDSAISRTAEKYGRFCHAIAYNITQNPEDSEECVNDTWLRAWSSIPPTRPQSLSAFLGRITRNLSLDRLRRRSAEKRADRHVSSISEELAECIPAENNTANIADDLVLAALINRFLESLPAQTRKIFLRRYWYFSSIRDIAADYGMSESKIKMMMLRTRNALRRQLVEEGFTV